MENLKENKQQAKETKTHIAQEMETAHDIGGACIWKIEHEKESKRRRKKRSTKRMIGCTKITVRFHSSF